MLKKDTYPTLENILQNYYKIKHYIYETPLIQSQYLNELVGGKIYLKCENQQVGGAFKARGAITAILNLSEEERQKGVTTNSSGNHAGGVAIMAKRFGLKAHIIMPSNTPQCKQSIVKQSGAEIYYCEPTVTSRDSKQNEVIKQTGAHFIHPFDDYRVITGQASIAVESFNQLKSQNQNIDYFLAPISGGGLISGSILALNGLSPSTKVIGVEPYLARDAHMSLQEGKIMPQLPPLTIADGLRMPLKESTWQIIRKHIDQILLVEESEIVETVNLLLQQLKIVVEPSGAVTLAAVIKNKHLFKDKTVVCVLSGGNMDLTYNPKL